MAVSFTADDGVRIGYVRCGSGPPLVLVHGGATDHRCFDPVVEQLAGQYTVLAYDRRGRGLSPDDGAGYSLEREADDFVAAARLLGGGEPVDVIGYSFGATVALHTVLTRPAPVRALVAYEAPFDVPGLLPAEEQIGELVAGGRDDEAVRVFVRDTFHLSDSAVDAMAAHPMWQVSLATVGTLPRECAALKTARLEPAREVPPVRYLVAQTGGNPAFRDIADRVRRAVPGSDVATVPGLPHFAMATEPAVIVTRAVEHLQRHS